ncbi:hypothetical protein D3C71_1933970 [compost metagenome]
MDSSFHLPCLKLRRIFSVSKVFCQYSFHCLSVLLVPQASSMDSGLPSGRVR